MGRRHPPCGVQSGQQPPSAASARVAIDQGRAREQYRKRKGWLNEPRVVYVSLALEMKAALRDKSASASEL